MSEPPLPEETRSDDLPRMTLLEHLEELRWRLVWSLLAVAVAFLVCWTYADSIFHFLARPVYAHLPPGSKLVFLKITDPFLLYMKVAALAGCFLASPFLLYQLWRFVAPALYQRERRYVLPFILSGSFFFVAGGAFAYYVAFPFAIEFLLNAGKEFQPMITVEGYTSFLMTVILGLGLMFELPVVIFLLCEMGVVKPRFLMRHFRWAVLITFIAAAIITPTADIFNMCLFALPALGLYLLGVGAAAIAGRRRRPAVPVRR